MNNLTIQSELTLAGILTMYLYYYYLPILSNKKTGDLFPDRQLNEPSQFDYKNNPIPNMNNNPLIIIIRGAICLSSIGLTFITVFLGQPSAIWNIIIYTIFHPIVPIPIK
jgi:hypothetical protein